MEKADHIAAECRLIVGRCQSVLSRAGPPGRRGAKAMRAPETMAASFSGPLVEILIPCAAGPRATSFSPIRRYTSAAVAMAQAERRGRWSMPMRAEA